MHTAQATNAELQKAIARMVHATAQLILSLIQQGSIYELGRRMAGGKALIIIEDKSLDIESWNIWIEATNNPQLQCLKIDETTVALYDKELTRCDVINILRKTTLKTDGSGFITIKEAVDMLRDAEDRGKDALDTFLEFVKIIGKSHKLIA